jgi:hypothetical protein
MNACDHSKQGLETQIDSETHNDSESEVEDGCESSKNVPEDIRMLLMLYDQWKLWVKVSIPKSNFHMITLI